MILESVGLASFAWFWIWFFVVKNDPAEDKHISEAERRYIKEKLNCTYEQEKVVLSRFEYF